MPSLGGPGCRPGRPRPTDTFALRAEGRVDTPALADRYLSADLAARYKAQLASDEVQPATGFDWRFDAQEFQITNLEVHAPLEAVVDGVSYSDIDVSFENFGDLKEITYSLCLGPLGWRIYDARSRGSGEEWSLRETLLRVEGKVSC